MADRHRALGEVGPQLLPHRARHLSVAGADRIRAGGGVQRELGQPERLRLLVRGCERPSRDERVDADPGLVRERAGDARQLLDGVGVVARRDRRVGREPDPLACARERLLEVAPALDLTARELERRERGMPLVEVQLAGVDSHRRERAHRAYAEQEVLREPHVGVADVEARRGPAGDRRVLRAVGVEQVERNPSDVDAPDLGAHTVVADRHRHRDGGAVRAGDDRRRQPLGVAVDPVLVLASGGVDVLAEEALAVEQADGDERQRVVRCLLEEVAGERAEAAGVDRQRRVHAVLGAQEDPGALGADGRRRTRPGELGVEPPERARDPPRRRRRRAAARGERRRRSASCSSRTGLPATRRQRSGSMRRNASPPPGCQDQW